MENDKVVRNPLTGMPALAPPGTLPPLSSTPLADEFLCTQTVLPHVSVCTIGNRIPEGKKRENQNGGRYTFY